MSVNSKKKKNLLGHHQSRATSVVKKQDFESNYCKKKECVHVFACQTVREKTLKMHLIPICPKAVSLLLAFFVMRRLALRGDTTPPDYSEYSCCAALF